MPTYEVFQMYKIPPLSQMLTTDPGDSDECYACKLLKVLSTSTTVWYGWVGQGHKWVGPYYTGGWGGVTSGRGWTPGGWGGVGSQVGGVSLYRWGVGLCYKIRTRHTYVTVCILHMCVHTQTHTIASSSSFPSYWRMLSTLKGTTWAHTRMTLLFSMSFALVSTLHVSWSIIHDSWWMLMKVGVGEGDRWGRWEWWGEGRVTEGVTDNEWMVHTYVVGRVWLWRHLHKTECYNYLYIDCWHHDMP